MCSLRPQSNSTIMTGRYEIFASCPVKLYCIHCIIMLAKNINLPSTNTFISTHSSSQLLKLAKNVLFNTIQLTVVEIGETFIVCNLVTHHYKNTERYNIREHAYVIGIIFTVIQCVIKNLIMYKFCIFLLPFEGHFYIFNTC